VPSGLATPNGRFAIHATSAGAKLSTSEKPQYYKKRRKTMTEVYANQAQLQVAQEMTSTTFDLPGYRVVRTVGVVRGITVRSANFAKQFTGAFRTLVCGEIEEYVELAEKGREQAYIRLLQHAAVLGANASWAFDTTPTNWYPT